MSVPEPPIPPSAGWNLWIVIEKDDDGEEQRWLPIDHGLEFLDAVEAAEAMAAEHPTAQAGPHEWLDS